MFMQANDPVEKAQRTFHVTNRRINKCYTLTHSYTFSFIKYLLQIYVFSHNICDYSHISLCTIGMHVCVFMTLVKEIT